MKESRKKAHITYNLFVWNIQDKEIHSILVVVGGWREERTEGGCGRAYSLLLGVVGNFQN